MQSETGSKDEAILRQLQEEHRRYSERLEGFSQTSYLSADEQIEEVRLKKLKLRVKDEMGRASTVIRSQLAHHSISRREALKAAEMRFDQVNAV